MVNIFSFLIECSKHFIRTPIIRKLQLVFFKVLLSKKARNKKGHTAITDWKKILIEINIDVKFLLPFHSFILSMYNFFQQKSR